MSVDEFLSWNAVAKVAVLMFVAGVMFTPNTWWKS